MSLLRYIIYALPIVALLLVFYLIFRKQINFLVVAFTTKRRIQRKILRSCKLNDFLTMSDIYFPIENGECRYIDTIIFGTKFIYLVKVIKSIGTIKIDIDDRKWRVVYKNEMNTIDNPLIENRSRIDRIISVVKGISKSDMKSIVVFSSTCNFDPTNNNDFEFVVQEQDVIKLIIEIEKRSSIDIFEPKDVERYARAFYDFSYATEKKVKKIKKNAKNKQI